jgi:hypothetical protein
MTWSFELQDFSLTDKFKNCMKYSVFFATLIACTILIFFGRLLLIALTYSTRLT